MLGVLAFGKVGGALLETRLPSILENSRVLRGLTTRRAVATVVGLAAFILHLSMLRAVAQTLPGPRKVVVQVVSADGSPRALAYVSEKLSLQNAATTDAGGRCEISINDPGVSRSFASWPGSSTCAVFTVPTRKIEGPVVVKLDSPLGHLYQRVTDGQGHGVSGVSVAARLTLPDGGSIEAPPQMTDAAGYCDFGLIPMIQGGSIQTTLSRGGSNQWSQPTPLSTRGREIFLADLVDTQATSHGDKPAWARVGGSVRGGDGQPVAEAEVRLVWKTLSEMGVSDRMAVTDTSGRWTTLLPPDGQIQHLQVWHPQFVIESMSIGSSGPSPDQMRAGTAVTVLHRGVPLEGVVRDENGSAVPDVLILTRSEMSIGMSGPVEDPSMGHTGKDGKFHVGSLDPGPRRLSTFSNQYLSVTADVNVQPGMKPVEFTVSKGGSVTGVVLDREGKPVAGANVTASSIAPDLTDGGPPQPPRRVVTDAGGHFRLDLLPTDKPFDLMASTSLGASGEYRGATVQDVPYLITMSPRAGGGGGKLVTVLDDATGMPVTRYRLFDGPQLVEGGPAEFSQGLRFTVDSQNGTYTRRAAYRDRPVGLALRVIADGYFPVESPIVPGGESKPFVLRLKKGKPVGGTVVDAEGKPVGGAQVAWVSPGRQAFIDANGNISDRYLASPEVIVKSAADGHFEFPPGMPAGAVVAAGATGYAQVASGEFHDGIEIKLSPWARVQGRLHIRARSPANLGLQVLPLDPQVRSKVNPIRWMISTRPRPDGTFVFEHLPAIPMAVGIVQLRGVSSRVLIEPGAGQTVDVQIGGGGRELSGDLQFAPGVGIERVPAEPRPGQPRVWIVLRPAADAVDDPAELPDQVDPRRLFYSGTVSDGRHFTFSDVPPGEYVLHVKVLAPPTRNPRGNYLVTGRATLPITVPAGDGTIDVGEVQVRVVPDQSQK